MELIDGLLWVTLTGLALAVLDRVYLRRFFAPEGETGRSRVLACPMCGGTDLSALDDRPFIWGRGIKTWHTCRTCGFRGLPIEFDSEEDHRWFLEGEKAAGEPRDRSGKVFCNRWL